MKIFYGLVFAILSFGTFVEPTTWNKCKDENVPELPVKKLTIDACPGNITQHDHQCHVKVGQKLEVNVKFSALLNASELRPKIKVLKKFGLLMGTFKLDYDLPGIDLCNFLKPHLARCPLKKDDVASVLFWLDTDELENITGISLVKLLKPVLDMELYLYNEKKDILGCISIPSSIS